MREKEDENFDLDGSLASAWLFHLEIIEPRKNKLPLHKRRGARRGDEDSAAADRPRLWAKDKKPIQMKLTLSRGSRVV